MLSVLTDAKNLVNFDGGHSGPPIFDDVPVDKIGF